MSTTTDNVVMPTFTTFDDLPNDVLDIIYKMKRELEQTDEQHRRMKDVMVELRGRVTPYQGYSINDDECDRCWVKWAMMNECVVKRTGLRYSSWCELHRHTEYQLNRISRVLISDESRYKDGVQYFANDQEYITFYFNDWQVDQFMDNGETLNEYLLEVAIANWIPEDEEYDRDDMEQEERLINIARREHMYVVR